MYYSDIQGKLCNWKESDFSSPWPESTRRHPHKSRTRMCVPCFEQLLQDRMHRTGNLKPPGNPQELLSRATAYKFIRTIHCQDMIPFIHELPNVSMQNFCTPGWLEQMFENKGTFFQMTAFLSFRKLLIEVMNVKWWDE